jgi:hypothetical protein
MTVDGLVAIALGLDDPLGDAAPPRPTPWDRTEAYWRAARFPPTRSVRAPWREQSHHLVRTAAFTGGAGRTTVPYGDFDLPLHDAMLDRAFECWVHAEDIAEAVSGLNHVQNNLRVQARTGAGAPPTSFASQNDSMGSEQGPASSGSARSTGSPLPGNATGQGRRRSSSTSST